jgi:hypothetical protein
MVRFQSTRSTPVLADVRSLRRTAVATVAGRQTSFANTLAATTGPAASNTSAGISTNPSTGTQEPAAGPDWRVLFRNTDPPAAPVVVQAAPARPSAEALFGPNPWMTAPSYQAPNGASYSYNPMFFATPETAAKVASILGGTVEAHNEITPNGGPFMQSQPNLMVRLPGGGLLNAGIVATYYTHGYPQSYIDTLIAKAVAEVNAEQS